MNAADYRLPWSVVPNHYDIDIDASPKRARLTGRVAIEVKVKKSVDEIILHGRGMKIVSAQCVIGRKKLNPTVKIDKATETLRLQFDQKLPRGAARLILEYRAPLSTGMHGLYRAEDGPERALVSQCEATDARAIFPCWDEPEFKATLKWTVRTDPGFEVITNGVFKRKQKSRKKPVRVVHHFETTRIIPTYLAAITIGEYDATAPVDVAGTPSRILCGKGKLGQTDFAQAVTSQVIPWYEKYFGHKYNYQKIDQVAVPGFDAGAMENVGAIFYRQTLLLMDPEATSWGTQKRIAEVVAHEIAHQWFGNLVTMKWWDDLWLNEAFATWIAYKACDAWKPNWRMWDDYQESKESALDADSLVNTHPIYTPVKSPAEATELFDLITYEKGCAVLRMAESYLGEEKFRAGIQAYIKRFKNKNAAGSDLWSALATASQIPVDELMQSWVTQSGFPLLNARIKRSRGKTFLQLEQRRFFADASLMAENNEQQWLIPVTIQYGTADGSHTHRILMNDRKLEVELPTTDKVLWAYPNHDASGFYRMHLNQSALTAVLKHGLPHLSAAARMSIIEDQWALVRNGLSTVGQFFDVLRAFRNDRDHIVMRTVASRLDYLSSRLVSKQDRDRFQAFARWLMLPQFEELGWGGNGEEPEIAVRRAAIIGTLGKVAHDENVLEEAVRRTTAEMDDPSALEPNLAGIAISLAAQTGDKKRLKAFVDCFLDRKAQGMAPELQGRYLSALTNFERRGTTQQVLSHCLDGTIPQEQLRTVLVMMLMNRSTQNTTWKFIKENWPEIAPQIGAMGMSRLVESTGALPPKMKSDIQRFFKQNPVEEARRALQKALEALDLTADLLGREEAHLGAWLQSHENEYYVN